MRALTRFLLIGVAAVAISGCVLLDVKRQQQKLSAFCTVSGTVVSEESEDKPLVVVLVRRDGPGEKIEHWSVFDHYVLERGGRWMFRTDAGVYGLAAFQDTHDDLVYRPGEPFLRVDLDNLLDCKPGDEIKNIALSIPVDGRPRIDGPLDIAKLRARTIQDQMRTSIGLQTAVGEVADLGDPRFSEENARMGLWRPFDFLFDARPGIYLLEPYDPNKTPVLFVHGIQGTPRNFETIIRNLDRGRFQPMVYYYPSGVDLSIVADHLNQTMLQLRRQLGFDDLYVIAHSAGGLVSRSFILRYAGAVGHGDIPVFATIATPWGGVESAGRGVANSPVVVGSWRSLAPDSPFLTEMFFEGGEAGGTRKYLPATLTYHLLFAFRRNSSSFGPSDDGTITVESQTRWEAQDDADHRLYGFNETHVGVLESEETSRLINEILADRGF